MAYSDEQKEKIFSEIIKDIERGNALRASLKNDNRPSSSTFFEWIDNDAEKAKRYTRACEDRAEAIFEEMIEIADDGSNDFMTIEKGDMKYNVEDREVTNRSRLRIDTRKWMLSKMNPKKYGDKLDVTSDNEKINTPQTIQIEITKLDNYE